MDKLNIKKIIIDDNISIKNNVNIKNNKIIKNDTIIKNNENIKEKKLNNKIHDFEDYFIFWN